jgi:cyclopropane-fatty-acyl-phospholipid synthase
MFHGSARKHTASGLGFDYRQKSNGRKRRAERTAPIKRMSTNDAEKLALQLLEEMFANIPDVLGVRLWNGKLWPDERPRAATLVLQHPNALARILSAGTEAGLAEGYLHNDFELEGDIEAIFECVEVLLGRLTDWRKKWKMAAPLWRLQGKSQRHISERLLPKLRGGRHSPERDRRAVTFHYDLSNDFYQLWLDEQMVYSCAYFDSHDDNLNAAQRRKLDYICRKIRLSGGQRLLDIGCGWGGLTLHAAKHFGVHSTGITLSERQAEEARARIAAADMEATVEIRVCDYRDLTAEANRYDAIVSVGMAEHVGREQLPKYFAIAHRLLKPRGVFLNQAIGAGTVSRADNSKGSFIERYVFPDGDMPPLPILLSAAESAGFEIRDVENLREHYAITLRCWLRNLEERHTEALAFASEETYRVWRLYLAGSGHCFRRGQLGVYQTLLAKLDDTGAAGLLLTREDWYRQTNR